MRRIALALVTALVGCTALSDALEPSASPEARYCQRGDQLIPAGMLSAEGCNECFCPRQSNACDGSICQGTCFSAACFNNDAGPNDTGTLYNPPKARCGPGDPCQEGGLCYYEPGCDSPRGWCGYTFGFCARGDGNPPQPWDPASPMPDVLFCGCDGTTYQGGSQGGCPMVPYSGTGACP